MSDSDKTFPASGVRYWFNEASDIDLEAWDRLLRKSDGMRAVRAARRQQADYYRRQADLLDPPPTVREKAMAELEAEWERDQVEALKARLRRRARAWFFIKSLFPWRVK